MAEGIAGIGERLRDWADDLQRRHSIVGFPYGVIKKYGDDEGGRHAALLTYYGFLSIFPLLLLVVVIVQMVLQGDPQLRQEIIDNIVPPDLQDTVENAVSRLPSNGVPLVVAIVGLLFSTMGIVFSAYQTLNHLAAVPHRKRHEFLPRYLRILAMLVVLVVGIVGVGALGVLVAAIPDLPGDSRIAAAAGTSLLVFGILWAATALLLPHRARLHVVWPAALLGALAITGLLTFGARVLPRLIARSGPVYGSFATIVGIFALLYLVSQVLVYAGEIAIVRRRRLWPRALDMTKPTAADRRALTYLAREQERTVVERIDARFDAPPPS
ncbi:MAG TPA: YihY/virulence factor BrkB family protein [Candidatus Nanopelagicales bacterium]|nr:YihY/virulence factor BrkB family protein [Candidatus Nanopelagicales bacterium]